jgi:mono/diheme cytochrome c family protein/sugar phosphate isomerase/epimerase
VKSTLIGCLLVLAVQWPLAAQEPAAQEPAGKDQLFARENLVAWCIVPFDAKKRGPEERAAMLKKLGFTKFAYDYRAEHIPTFDAEMEALKKHGIKLTAWWFPGNLNDEARGILDVLKRHKLKTQLWVTGGGESTKSAEEQAARVKAEAARIRPIAEEAAKIGCSVALYNHGGWFGEPENQLAIIEELKLHSVGIVYNQHHGHDHLGRFPELLKTMLPHLVCLNLNGMTPDGERRGQKILPLGQGELDLGLLKTIRESGYRGPIGILGHTQDDAQQRLADNLDGLAWLVKQLDGQPAGEKPQPRTPVPAATGDPKRAEAKPPRALENHWGRAMIGFDWKEADSVDNRWNQTDVGPFLASLMPLPDGRAKLPLSRGSAGASPSQEPSPSPAARPDIVAKGLSIKVGDRGQGTVCYDTQTLSLRAAWTGGFLKFDPARYGLINSPKIAGDVAFASLKGFGWEGTDFQYLGMSLHDDRVVLSARAYGKLIRESPWLEEKDGLVVFTRTIEVEPSTNSFARLLGAFPGKLQELQVEGMHALALVDGERATAFAAVGDVKSLGLGEAPDDAPVRVPYVDFVDGEKPGRMKLHCWSGDKSLLPKFVAAVKASPPPEDLAELSKPGKPRWTEEIVTRGVVGGNAPARGDSARGASGPQSPYVVDTLTLPFDNPYKALLFASGHDFFANGDIALCTVHGDVWRASGVDGDLDRLVWKRMATGLFQPLGLKIVEDQVHVLGRDQITRLVDHNGDGEADEYRCFCNLYETSADGHDYVTCLETDAAGHFYLLHARQGVVRVARDGRSVQSIATGLRNPNGMSIGPEDVITAAPQEGEWTPGSMIFEVKPGGHYGYQGPREGHGPEGFDPPLAWLPRMMDNSSGGQVWATSERWGPLGRAPGVGSRESKLLHLAYGKCRLILVLRERIGETTQGAVVEVPGVSFASGAMRGRFSPHDGQLYVSGLKGWATAAVDDGCLQRVRFTGKSMALPIDRKTYANGLAVTFTEPLDAATAEDPGSYHLQQWNYHYSAAYGSPDLKLSDPTAEGHDEVAVRSATLLDGGRTVFLEIPGLAPANQTSIEYSLRTAAGQPLRQTLVATTHVVPERRMDAGPLRRQPAADDLVDESSLAPGVKLEIKQGAVSSVRTSRLVAWNVPADQAAGGGLAPGPFAATASGFIKVPLRGDYQLHLTGSGKATLRVNGQMLMAIGNLSVIAPNIATLRQGYNRLEVQYSSPPNGPSELRLWWTDGTFAAEPVPPTALYHDARDEQLRAAEQFRRGFLLAGQRLCAACHAAPGASRPTFPTAPSLAGSGSRLEPRWIYDWLLDPAAIRPQAHMPRLFDAEQAADRQAAADIAAYLMTLASRDGQAPAEPQNREGEAPAEPRGSAGASPSQTSPSQTSPSGAALFEDLACVACHRLTPPSEDDQYDRLPLGHAAGKFRPGKLAEFLRRPQAHYAQSRMPDFSLTAVEAAALAEHLAGGERAKLPAITELARADARRGEALFREHRCGACHATAGDQRGQVPAPGPAPEWILLGKLDRGCLAAQKERRGKAPHYTLSAREVADLAAYYGRQDAARPGTTIGEMLPLVLDSLRCGACHNRDHHVAPLRRIIVEESEHGVAPDPLPNLTWTGEKLHVAWLSKLLSGELPYRTRPWLKARMPSFPSHSESLARALAGEHGIADSPAPASRESDPSLAVLGDRLARKDGGLDCRSCHAVGKDQPTGDERTKVAQGINFVHIRERMPADFYLRFVLDPPRHDVTTRMPKLSADGKTTNATAILDGDARQQFEAIWQYIQTVR